MTDAHFMYPDGIRIRLVSISTSVNKVLLLGWVGYRVNPSRDPGYIHVSQTQTRPSLTRMVNSLLEYDSG